jgi:hypothetical protein
VNLTVAGPRRLADWFGLLISCRSSLTGELMVSGFVDDLIVGLGAIDGDAAADALD